MKRLHRNQKLELDEAVKTILANPLIGEQKVGDLARIVSPSWAMS